MEALNKFVRLNNQNWQTWKFRMEMLLTREELWYVIETPKPAANASQWEKDDKKARATMGLCIEENQYGLIKTAASATDFWNNLKQYHEKVTVTSRVSLLKRLCSMNLLEDGDLECYLFEMEELFDRLTQAGQALSDSLKVAMVLRSLPDSYSGLVTALESRPDADLTLVLVKSKLLDEFERRKERSVRSSSECSSEVKALKSFSHRNCSSWRCFCCNEKGHLKRDCPVLQRQKEESEKKKNESSAAKQVAVHDRSAVLFLANQGRSSGWIIDSGASVHMCNDKRHFETFDDNVSDVILADGKSVKSVGSGNVKITGMNGCGGTVDVILENALYVPSLKSGLLSVKMLTAKGFVVVFRKNDCDILNAAGKVIAKGDRYGSLYQLRTAERTLNVVGKTSGKRNEKYRCRRKFERRASVAVEAELQKEFAGESSCESESVLLDDPDDSDESGEQFFDASCTFLEDQATDEGTVKEELQSVASVPGKLLLNYEES